MIIVYTSAVLHKMFTELIIPHPQSKKKKSTGDILKFFFSDLFQKTGFDKERDCMKCQIMFSDKKCCLLNLP